MSGLFLTVEGLGGTGKSTLSKKIAKWFDDAQVPNILTFEPGGCDTANYLRKLCREGLPGCEELTPMGKALLFNTARAEHVKKVIQPALEAGKVVISDRYMMTTMGYQGIGEGVPLFTLSEIHHHAIGLVPDLTFMMQGDPEVFMARVSGEEKSTDQFDRWELSLNERIQDYYDQVVKSRPDLYIGVDAEQDPEQMFAQVLPTLMKIQNDRIQRPKYCESIKIPPSLR